MKPATLVLSVLAVLISLAAFLTNPEPIVGAFPGGDILEPVSFSGGVTQGGVTSTTTTASSVTVSPAEIRAWGKSSVVMLTPGLTAVTLTLPASSTLPSFLPKPGDRTTVCFRNATTTAGTVITFAGSTGTNFLVASSSATAVGSSVLLTGKAGCMTLIRGPVTATAFDIDVLYTAFK